MNTKMRTKKMTMMISARRCFLAILLSAACIGCASTPTEPPKAATPEPQAQPAPEPPKETAEPAPAPEPEISPALKKLRNSIASGNANDIKAAAHEIIDAEPEAQDSAEALRALATTAIAEQKYDEAMLYADAASKIKADDLDTMMLKAKINVLRDDHLTANKQLQAAIQAFPNAYAPHLLKAAIAIKFLDSERALEDAAAASALAPQNCDVLIIHGDALYLNLKYEQAIASYEKADAAQCKLTEPAILNMAKIYEVQLQAPAKSCKAYERLVQIAPDNAYYKASRDYQCSL